MGTKKEVASEESFAKAKKDEHVRSLLIEKNRGLVSFVIKRYFNRYPYLKEDLFGYGVFGLVEAIEKFNPQKGKFSTYAIWWVRQFILREIRKADSLIRLPEHIVEEGERLETFLKEGGKGDACCYVGVSVKKMKLLEEIRSSYVISFSTPISSSNKDERVFGDFIPTPNRSIEETAHFASIRRLLSNKLSPRDYNVLSKIYGLDGKGERTFEEVGIELGKEKKIARQTGGNIHERALQKAKKIMERAGVRSAHF